MVKACAGTSSVGPANPTGTLVWVGFNILSTTVAAALTQPFPWIGAVIANRLLSLDNLCATPLDVPDAWVNDDLVGTIGDFLNASPPSAAFMVKLEQYIQYHAFRSYCQCNVSTACVSTTYSLDLSTNLAYNTTGVHYVWPDSTYGVVSSETRQYQPWNAGCSNVDITIWLGNVGDPGQPQLVTHIFDCQGQIYSQSHIMGTAQNVNLRAGCTGFSVPGFNLTWDWNVTPTTYPHWTVVVAPHGSQTTTGTQPVDSPPPVITVPTPPTQACDATTLCNINWFTVRNIQNTFTNVTDINVNGAPSLPSRYVLGATHSVTGVGELTVSGVVGLLVSPTGFVAGTGFDESDPTRWFDIGFVAFGNVDGWEANQRVIHDGQVLLTQLQDVTRVGYNCLMSEGYTITELVRSS